MVIMTQNFFTLLRLLQLEECTCGIVLIVFKHQVNRFSNPFLKFHFLRLLIGTMGIVDFTNYDDMKYAVRDFNWFVLVLLIFFLFEVRVGFDPWILVALDSKA